MKKVGRDGVDETATEPSKSGADGAICVERSQR
jgi:hypothetical protein